MTTKEQNILNAINTYFLEFHTMPTIRQLQNRLKYKSPNSIQQFLKALSEKGYIKKTLDNKWALVTIPRFDGLVNIKVLNTKEILTFSLNINKDYIAFKIKNNFFENYHISKDDYLIIEKTRRIKNGEIGLFMIDKKYRIMQYQYRDGFHILFDYEEIILYKVKLIGKVVMINRMI